jgi:hypothetical protein
MTDLQWDEVWPFFDPELMGTLPDVVIEETGVEDWQALLDLIGSRGWECAYCEDGEACTLPAASELLARKDVTVELKVWPAPGLLAIFRPWGGAESINFDIDLRQVQGQERLEIFCTFFAAIGRRLRKPVLMMPEGHDEHPVLGFDVAADRVVLLADPDQFACPSLGSATWASSDGLDPQPSDP